MKKLIVYTSKKCPRCKALKKWLHINKLPFAEKDLTNTDVMTELVMRNLVVLSAPILKNKNKFFLSHQIFDKNNRLNPELKQLLKLTKRREKRNEKRES